jgi:hypothetical protein
MKKLLICFAAGCLGGLIMSLAMWAAGNSGIAASLDVRITPDLTPPWLCQRVVWGGIWGFLFLLPILSSKSFARGTLMSLFPTLVQLFYVFPYQAGKGMAGIELGLLTPVFVLVYNWIWGVVTAGTIKLSR